MIVGCAKNSTESSVHPLVGVWNATEMTMSSEGTTITIEYDENNSMTYIFSEDGVFSVTAEDENGISSDNGNWSATGDKLTMFDEENTVIFDFSISGNILSISDEESMEDGSILAYTVTFKKQ